MTLKTKSLILAGLSVAALASIVFNQHEPPPTAATTSARILTADSFAKSPQLSLAKSAPLTPPATEPTTPTTLAVASVAPAVPPKPRQAASAPSFQAPPHSQPAPSSIEQLAAGGQVCVENKQGRYLNFRFKQYLFRFNVKDEIGDPSETYGSKISEALLGDESACHNSGCLMIEPGLLEDLKANPAAPLNPGCSRWFLVLSSPSTGQAAELLVTDKPGAHLIIGQLREAISFAAEYQKAAGSKKAVLYTTVRQTGSL